MLNALNEIKRIGATNSSNEKLELLRRISPLTKQIFLYSLDPYRMFGVKKYPVSIIPKEHGGDVASEMFKALDGLHTRQVTGHAALNLCTYLDSIGIPEEILSGILTKDLRCGVRATLFNKVYKDFIPEFLVALAEDYDFEADDQWPMYESIKYDGLRGLFFVEYHGVTPKTRNGLEITSADAVKGPLLEHTPSLLPSGRLNIIFDGELKKVKGHFQDSMSSIRKKKVQSTDLEFLIFDYITTEEFDAKEAKETQKQRIERLEAWAATLPPGLPFRVVKHSLIHNNEEAQALYKAALANKEEGLILKDPDAPYSFGRSKAWVKMKDIKTADVTVLRVEEGKGKNKGKVGALVVDFNNQENRVGGGYSDKLRDLWFKEPHLIVGRTVEVLYHELTKDGNMRHSRFNCIRFDKE